MYLKPLNTMSLQQARHNYASGSIHKKLTPQKLKWTKIHEHDYFHISSLKGEIIPLFNKTFKGINTDKVGTWYIYAKNITLY